MKEIAANLGLSDRTVETHKYEMMETLGLHSTAELVQVRARSPARCGLIAATPGASPYFYGPHVLRTSSSPTRARRRGKNAR